MLEVGRGVGLRRGGHQPDRRQRRRRSSGSTSWSRVARERLQRLGYDNVEIVEGDGSKGWPDDAPFNAILAAASGSHVPQPLIDQLAPGGRLVMPLGDPGWVQELVKVTKGPGDKLVRENLGGVRFVPLIGEEGFKAV